MSLLSPTTKASTTNGALRPSMLVVFFLLGNMWSSTPTTNMRTTPAARRGTSRKTMSVLRFTFSFRLNRNEPQTTAHSLPMTAPLFWRPRLQVEIFDEHDFIALFVIDKLIDKLLRQQDAEAARAHALCVTILYVTHRIVRGVGDGSMGNLIQCETLARIADAARHHMTRAHVRNLHLLIGVKTPAVLDCVRK